MHRSQNLISAGDRATIGTGFAVAVPDGVYGQIAPRSGLAAKHMIDIGAGVVDPDCTGKIKVVIFNHSRDGFAVKTGDKIAQLILERVSILEPEICVQRPLSTQTKKREDSAALTQCSCCFGYLLLSLLVIYWERCMVRHATRSRCIRTQSVSRPSPFSACVARPVPRKEANMNPNAFAALEKEWKKIRDMGCWDQSTVTRMARGRC